jgi:hypothetical protein
MNSETHPVSTWEAHTLGKITAICARYPGVLAAWHAADEQGAQA